MTAAQPAIGKNVKLIVFDLDETLVHASETPLPYPHSFKIASYFVYVRPYAAELIQRCATRFDIAVWSSSSALYVEAVTRKLFGNAVPLKFSWSESKCVQKVDPKSNSYVFVKDLRKVIKHGYTPEQILMLDDSPEKLQRQPSRHLQVSPFTGKPDDTGLLSIIEILALSPSAPPSASA